MVEQVIVAQRFDTDCEVAALATATDKTWEEARGAVGWRDLPGPIENPVFGNPANVSAAANRLGWQAVEIGLTPVLEYRATPGRVLVLVHALDHPYQAQHWVVWFGGADGHHCFAWGDGKVTWRKAAEVVDLVTGGWPNCVMELRPASKKGWFKWLWDWVRGIRW